MGGYGSGRWYRYDSRDTVESYHRIDLRYIRKHGLLDRPWFSLSWRRGREPSGSVGVSVERDDDGRPEALRLTYRYRRGYGGEWQDVTDRIRIEWTPCNLGGERPWLMCPGCRKRRAVLCGGTYFRCRECHGLAYESSRESVLERTDRKLRKLRERMGDENAWIGPADLWYPEKPKGMHWCTWERLWRQWRSLCYDHRILWGRELAWMAVGLSELYTGEEERTMRLRLQGLEAEAAALGLVPPSDRKD